MHAGGRKSMDRTLETVEHMRLATHSYLKAFIVDVTAYFTRRCLIAQHTFTFIHAASFL